MKESHVVRFFFTGAYVQWRARAIGEKGSTAEAKLEKVGPFDGMTVRRAMSVVLAVLKEVLEDDFSTDRLEMVCVDMGMRDTAVGSCGGVSGDGSEDDGDGNGGGKETEITPGAAGEYNTRSSVKRGYVAEAVVTSSGSGEGSSTRGGEPGTSLRNGGTNGVDGRDKSSGGVLEAGGKANGASDDGSSSLSSETTAASFVPRYGYFRRVSRSEMEELLADADGSIKNRSE